MAGGQVSGNTQKDYTLVTFCQIKVSYYGQFMDIWFRENGKGKVSLHTSLVAHQAGAYPGFSSMKRLGVFLLPPGWDASPSQGYPQHQIRRYPFIHLGGERHCESEVSCSRTQHNVPGNGSNPERSLRNRAH